MKNNTMHTYINQKFFYVLFYMTLENQCGRSKKLSRSQASYKYNRSHTHYHIQITRQCSKLLT